LDNQLYYITRAFLTQYKKHLHIASAFWRRRSSATHMHNILAVIPQNHILQQAEPFFIILFF